MMIKSIKIKAITVCSLCSLVPVTIAPLVMSIKKEFVVSDEQIDNLKNSFFVKYEQNLKNLHIGDDLVATKIAQARVEIQDFEAFAVANHYTNNEIFSWISSYANDKDINIVNWNLIDEYKQSIIQTAEKQIYDFDLDWNTKRKCLNGLENNLDKQISYCKMQNFSAEETFKYISSCSEKTMHSFTKDAKITLTTKKINEFALNPYLVTKKDAIFFDKLITLDGFEIGSDIISLLSDVLSYENVDLSQDTIKGYKLSAKLVEVNEQTKQISVKFGLIDLDYCDAINYDDCFVEANNNFIFKLNVSAEFERNELEREFLNIKLRSRTIVILILLQRYIM